MAIKDLIVQNTQTVEQATALLSEMDDKLAYQTTATAEQILKGFIGVYNGELVEGTASAGVSGIDYGTVTTTYGTTSVTVQHNLKTTPTTVLLLAQSMVYSDDPELIWQNASAYNSTFSTYGFCSSGGSEHWANNATAFATYDATSITFTLPSNAASYFCGGTYLWIAIGGGGV